jgi:hypothetical protein
MKIKKSTPPRVVAFLEQCRIDCKKFGRAWSPSATETEMKIGHGCFNSAVKCGYFTNNDGKWICNIDTFTIQMALNVAEKMYEYAKQKRIARDARGHVPKTRTKKTDEPAIAHPDETDKLKALKPSQYEQKQNPEQRQINFDNFNPGFAADAFKEMNLQQFLDVFRRSSFVMECKRRGLGIHVTMNTKIDL